MSPARTIPATRVCVALATVVALAAIAYGVAFAAQFWRVLPYYDQWAVVATYRRLAEGTGSLLDLLAPHNEHRLPFTKLAFVVDFAVFRGRLVLVQPLLIVGQLGLGVAVGLVASRGYGAQARLLAAVAGAAWLVAPVQIDNLVDPFLLQWGACGLLALASFYWTAQLAEPMPDGRATRIALAAAAVALAPFSSANGLAVPPLAVFMAFVLPVPRAARIALTAAAALSVAGFFVGYAPPPSDPAYRPVLSSPEGLLAFARYVAAFLGSIDQHHPDNAIAVGAAGLAAYVALVGVLLLALRSKRIDPSTAALAMLATMAVATAVMTGLGRAGAGPLQAMSWRYVTWSVLFWASLLGCGWRQAAAAGHTIPAVANLVIAAILVGVSYFPGRFIAIREKERAAAIDSLTAELRAGHLVPEHLSSVYPGSMSIVPLVEFLRARRLSIFAD